MPDREINVTIYGTTDYDQFHLIDGQRDVTRESIEDLRKKIREYNRLEKEPIWVTKDGGIIDGQRRWTVAKEEGLELFYRIDENYTDKDYIYINIGRRNLSPIAYAKFWNARGLRDYKIYLEFREKFGLPHYATVRLLAPKGLRHNIRDAFAKGALEIQDLGRAYEVAQHIASLATYFEDGRINAPFCEAVADIYDKDFYDPERMLDKAARVKTAFQRRSLLRDNYRMLEDVYNHNVKAAENRVHFYA